MFWLLLQWQPRILKGCYCRSSSSLCSDLFIFACLHFVYGLVAIVPGIQLFVSRVVVDAAVTGVALWEEHHRTLFTANGRKRENLKIKVKSCFSCETITIWWKICKLASLWIKSFSNTVIVCLLWTCMCEIQPVDAVMDVIETLYGGASSIACVVNHIEGPTHQEGSFSITAFTLCVPGIFYGQSCWGRHTQKKYICLT